MGRYEGEFFFVVSSTHGVTLSWINADVCEQYGFEQLVFQKMEESLFEAIQETDVFFLVNKVVVPPYCDISWGVCTLLLPVTMDKCLYNYVVMFDSV